MNTTTIIGITGASGAGKSVFAQQLHERLLREYSQQDVAILNEDAYYRDRSELSFEERERINYDHPDALEHGLLIEHLEQLRCGNAVDVPEYDYASHNRKPVTRKLHPSKVLILEGFMILHDRRLRDLMDLKIFVDVPMDVCLSRRLRRDIHQRGRTLDSVLTQYETTVRPMYYRFIEPVKTHADLIVPRGGENQNALDVLHSHLRKILT